MTRDEMVRLAREAGISLRYDGDAGCDVFGEESIDVLERFAALSADAARLEGWQAAREAAHKACTEYAESRVQGNIERAIGADRCASSIRAMQPPAEWGDIGIPAPCRISYVLTEKGRELANRIGDKYRSVAIWPHPDGFAGGLTERNEHGQDQKG